MTDKLSILFVDDEPRVLDGIRRMLRPMRNEWDVSFAAGGAEALEAMAEKPVDVVVTDMRMPGMSGSELLAQIQERYPRTVRLVLSGQVDKESVLRGVGPIHQFLSKPCDSKTLISALRNVAAARRFLSNGKIKQLVSQIDSLPSLPSLYNELLAKMNTPSISAKSVGDTIGRDVAMTAKILQLVNSSYFGLQRHVAGPAQAVALLGLMTVKALVLSINVFGQFESVSVKGFSLDALIHHSMNVAMRARCIARTEQVSPQICDDAFMAGILHDTGKLILAAKLPELYRQALELQATGGCESWRAEQEVFSATHAEVGAYLLGLWGFSGPVVDAVLGHHQPAAVGNDDEGQGLTVLAAVHAANGLMHCDEHDAQGELNVDREYLGRLGLADRIENWREASQQTVAEKDEQ